MRGGRYERDFRLRIAEQNETICTRHKYELNAAMCMQSGIYVQSLGWDAAPVVVHSVLSFFFSPPSFIHFTSSTETLCRVASFHPDVIIVWSSIDVSGIGRCVHHKQFISYIFNFQ